MKNRITKTLRAKAGFTLVELIVVIAILGILAGVGTVGYSGYIKKANMAADQTLISSIENALMLAGYGNTFAAGESGYITLSTDGIVNKDQITEGSGLDEAMKAAFGADYKDSMKLSYNGWGSSGVFDDLTEDDAFAVYYSSYMTGERKDVLLNDVEKMTDTAKRVVSVLSDTPGVSEKTLSDLFGDEVLNKTAAKYGITLEDGQSWDDWGAENDTAYGNLLVLTAADEAENNKRTGEPMSAASQLILEFSSYYGYAASNPEFSEVFDEKLNELDSITSVTEGANWYSSLKSAAGDGYDAYNTYNAEKGYNQGEADEWAFQSILSALGNPTEEQAANIAIDLNNPNLFTAGVVNNMYNDYLTAVDAVMANPTVDGLDLEDGEVVILFAHNSGEVNISNSLPTA